MGRLSASILFALALVSSVRAESPAVGLDFLVGTWQLRDASGKVIGTSVIEIQEAGAVLFERRTVGEGKPQSLWLVNVESPAGWGQLFLGPKRQVREFRAMSAPGVWPMVMGGEFVTQDGKSTRFRMTMTRGSDDETRRVLELSRDGGVNWSTAFDYTYARQVGN
jgi:hypothetical protein